MRENSLTTRALLGLIFLACIYLVVQGQIDESFGRNLVDALIVFLVALFVAARSVNVKLLRSKWRHDQSEKTVLCLHLGIYAVILVSLIFVVVPTEVGHADSFEDFSFGAIFFFLLLVLLVDFVGEAYSEFSLAELDCGPLDRGTKFTLVFRCLRIVCKASVVLVVLACLYFKSLEVDLSNDVQWTWIGYDPKEAVLKIFGYYRVAAIILTPKK